MDKNNRQFDEFGAGEGFGGDLKKLYGPKGEVPRRVDMAVTAAARKSLLRRAPGWLRWAGVGVAAAAVILVMLNIENGRPVPSQSVAPQAKMAMRGNTEDINGDGRVDMLDALKVARMVEAGKASIRLDFNGDGVVDKRDVDTVAMAAVKMGKG